MRFAAVLVLLITVSASAEPPRWKLSAGQEIRCRVTQRSAFDLQAGPAGGTQTTTVQTTDMTWVVEQVNDDGAARIRHDVLRVRASMVAPAGQGYELDTAAEEPPTGLLATILAPVFDALVEQDYTVTMTARGEITDVDAPAELLDTLKNLPGAGAGVAGEDVIRQLALQATLLLPEGEPAEGDAWSTTSETSAPLIGTQVVETEYRYDGPRSVGGRELDVFTPTVQVANAEPPAEGPAMTLAAGDSGGEALFDREAGRLVSSTVEQRLELEMEVAGQKITGAINQKSTALFGDAIPTEPAEAGAAN